MALRNVAATRATPSITQCGPPDAGRAHHHEGTIMPTSPTGRRRHPALLNTPIGTFNPEAVGLVPGYAKTPEAFEAQLMTLRNNGDRARAAGRNSRRGTPNGWAGKREEVQWLREEVKGEAWEEGGSAQPKCDARRRAFAGGPPGPARRRPCERADG
jgi:hypothetical protein